MPENACLHIQTRDTDPVRVVSLPGLSIRIGRASYCEVRLPEPEVAEEECHLKRRGRIWHLVPIGRPGAVRIDDHLVERSQPLPYGVPFRVGDHRLTLQSSEVAREDWETFERPITFELPDGGSTPGSEVPGRGPGRSRTGQGDVARERIGERRRGGTPGSLEGTAGATRELEPDSTGTEALGGSLESGRRATEIALRVDSHDTACHAPADRGPVRIAPDATSPTSGLARTGAGPSRACPRRRSRGGASSFFARHTRSPRGRARSSATAGPCRTRSIEMGTDPDPATARAENLSHPAATPARHARSHERDRGGHARGGPRRSDGFGGRPRTSGCGRRGRRQPVRGPARDDRLFRSKLRRRSPRIRRGLRGFSVRCRDGWGLRGRSDVRYI